MEWRRNCEAASMACFSMHFTLRTVPQCPKSSPKWSQEVSQNPADVVPLPPIYEPGILDFLGLQEDPLTLLVILAAEPENQKQLEARSS